MSTIMKCKKCGKEHDGSFGTGIFCSRSCSNSRIMTNEIKEKIGDGVLKSSAFWKSVEDRKDPNKSNEIYGKIRKFWNDKLMLDDYDTLSFERLRKRIIIEQDGKCNYCKIDKWNGEPIILEIDHKDGNHHNNKRENLEAICPNCHSQTATWRGRNKTSKRLKISDDEILQEYIKTNNIRQTLISVGLAPKGNNYKRVQKIISQIRNNKDINDFIA